MSDREKARDLGNQSAALARSIADVLNDTLDALETAENTGRGLESSYDRLAAERDEALRQASEAERDRLREELARGIAPHPCSFCQKPCYRIAYIGHRLACVSCFDRLAVQPALGEDA
jgi:hypothetical protein